MATQVSENPQTEQHYLAQVALSVALIEALRNLWPSVDIATAAGRTAVALLTERFMEASVSLSRDFYEATRDRAGITDPYVTPTVDLPPADALEGSLEELVREFEAEGERKKAEWEARMADLDEEVLAAERVRRQAEIDAEADRVLRAAEARMTAFVDGSGRDELLMAVEGDDEAIGFRRVPRPGACYFCLALSFRRSKSGHIGVYKSRRTAGQLPPNETGEVNRYHTNCKCVVVPVFSTTETFIEPHTLEAEELYKEAREKSRRTGMALQDFRNALYALRKGDAPRFDKFEDSPIATPAETGADQLASLQNILAAATR